MGPKVTITSMHECHQLITESPLLTTTSNFAVMVLLTDQGCLLTISTDIYAIK